MIRTLTRMVWKSELSARRGAARRLQWALTVLGLLALLQTAVGAIVVPDLAGWQPNHGHISKSTPTPAHTHPYEHASSADSSESPAVVFTMADEGTAGSVTSPAILDARVLPAAGVTFEVPAAQPESAVPPDAHIPVTTPPPRT